MNIKIAPSILSADFANLERDIRKIDTADYVHVDIMDGEFVPNISIGIPVVKAIRPVTGLPLDVHLMITKPVRYVEQFCDAGADLVTVHVESDFPENIHAALEKIHAKGKRAGIVLKPNTRAEAALPYLKECDIVLVMTVEPGFGGQKFMADMMPKVAQLRAMLDEVNPDCELEVDGGVDTATRDARVHAGMEYFPAALEKLVEQFARLPGIGGKSAQRLAFHVLSLTDAEAQEFADAIVEAKKKVTCCPICRNLTDGGLCPICASPKRDERVICVVADARDVAALERSREYSGRYHVLHGVISPMNHVGPDDLEIKSLVERVAAGGIDEVIMATNPDTEGEATAMYLARLLRPFGVKVTRLAYGIPVGGHLEFADDATLMRALEGRREI